MTIPDDMDTVGYGDSDDYDDDSFDHNCWQ